MSNDRYKLRHIGYGVLFVMSAKYYKRKHPETIKAIQLTENNHREIQVFLIKEFPHLNYSQYVNVENEGSYFVAFDGKFLIMPKEDMEVHYEEIEEKKNKKNPITVIEDDLND